MSYDFWRNRIQRALRVTENRLNEIDKAVVAGELSTAQALCEELRDEASYIYEDVCNLEKEVKA